MIAVFFTVIAVFFYSRAKKNRMVNRLIAAIQFTVLHRATPGICTHGHKQRNESSTGSAGKSLSSIIGSKMSSPSIQNFGCHLCCHNYVAIIISGVGCGLKYAWKTKLLSGSKRTWRIKQELLRCMRSCRVQIDCSWYRLSALLQTAAALSVVLLVTVPMSSAPF